MEWSLLAGLDEEDRRDVLASTRRRRFARDEVVVREGGPADSLHLMESGRVAVQVTTAGGATATLTILGPGSYFGELALLDGAPPTRSATVLALEPVETRVLAASAFADLRRRSRAAEHLLLMLLARRVEELSARLLEATYDTLDQRLHRRLHELAELYAEGPGPVTVPLRQEVLAELVGGTRPSVNQVLQRLVARGVVEVGRGRVTVLDRWWLAAHST